MSQGVSNQIYGIAYGNAKWVAAAIPTATGLGPEYHIMTSSTGISYAPSDSTGDTLPLKVGELLTVILKEDGWL